MKNVYYRAWNKNTKELEEVLLICFVNRYVMVLPERNLEGGEQEEWKFEDIELLQFTGLRDKNNVPIYEHDIVKILYTDWPSKLDEDTRTLTEYLDALSHIRIVHWDTQGFYISTEIGGYSESMEPGKYGYIQLIGNVYENPELIK